MEMFDHLGLTLTVLRTLKGMKQAELAARAGIGKSQLSKYEGGKELPKLAALGKLLRALDVTPLGFFYTLHLLDGRAKNIPIAGVPVADASVLYTRTGQALTRLLEDLMNLHGTLAEERLFRKISDLASAELADVDEIKPPGFSEGVHAVAAPETSDSPCREFSPDSLT